jgi:regulator of sirC expression with transglutaminase-like and TPR domain
MKLKQRYYVGVLVLLSIMSAAFLLTPSGNKLVLHICHASNRCNDIDKTIEATGATFGYSSDSCLDLIAMVYPWDLVALKSNIIKAKSKIDAENTTADHLMLIEEEAAHFLYDHIRGAIHSTGDFQCFDLAHIINTRNANCVGYSSLFYILGESIGLSIQVIEVQTDSQGQDMNHLACIVHLSDGTEIMADLIGGGFISKRFRFLDEFSKAGGLYVLKQKNNPLHLHRKVALLDRDGFASIIYSQRANHKGSGGKNAEALNDINKAIALNPINVRALCFRAILNKRLRKYPDAISDATKAIEIDPRSDRAYEIRGSAYSRHGDHKKAVADFSRSIDINPNYALAYVGRGYSMSRLGMFEEAKKDWKKAVELDDTLKELVEIYSNMAERGSIHVGGKRMPEEQHD